MIRARTVEERKRSFWLVLKSYRQVDKLKNEGKWIDGIKKRKNGNSESQTSTDLQASFCEAAMAGKSRGQKRKSRDVGEPRENSRELDEKKMEGEKDRQGESNEDGEIKEKKWENKKETLRMHEKQ